jgi:hypothetical protein
VTGLAKIEDMFGSISNDLVGGANQSQQCGSIEITWGFMFFTKINYGHCEIVTLILTIIPGPCDVAVRFWSRLLRCRENNICSKSPYISWFQSQSQFVVFCCVCWLVKYILPGEFPQHLSIPLIWWCCVSRHLVVTYHTRCCLTYHSHINKCS